MTENQTLSPSTILDERYEILSVAGVGGMGIVYRARHLALGRDVAIKVLHEELVGDADSMRRFKQEAQLAKDLNHANIASVYGFGIADNQPYIVMEFLQGTTLQQWLQDKGTLEPSEFYAIFKQVCDGLAHAHSHGVVHRDLKPGNVFIVGDTDALIPGAVRLVDFGIAKQIDPSADSQKLTKTGIMIGTPLYMSPEQSRGEKVGTASDIYSLGCVMYHAAYGSPPFMGETAYELLFNHAYSAPQLEAPPSGYPKPICDVFARAMAKDACDRYGTTDELSAALCSLQSGKLKSSKSIKTIPATPAIGARKERSHRSALTATALLAFAAVGLAVSGVYLWWQSPATKESTIVSGWHKKHDLSALRNQLRALAEDEHQPKAAQAIVESLADDLQTIADPESARIFLDCQKRLGKAARDDRLDSRHRAMLVIRQFPKEYWSGANNVGSALCSEVVSLDPQNVNKGDKTKTPFYAMQKFFHDNNLAAADSYAAKVLEGFAIDKHETGRNRKLCLLSSSYFWNCGNYKRAHQFVDCMLPPVSPDVAVDAYRAKAELFDAEGDQANAVVWWKKLDAIPDQASKMGPGMSLLDRAKYAEDTLTVDRSQGLAMLTHLVDQLDVAPEKFNDPLEQPSIWLAYLIAGNAYVSAGEQQLAKRTYEHGLRRAETQIANRIESKPPRWRGTAYGAKAVFLTHLGQFGDALKSFAKAFEAKSKAQPAGVAAIDQLLKFAGVTNDLQSAAVALNPLPEGAKPAARAHLQTAVNECAAAENAEFRRQLAKSAVHRLRVQAALEKICGPHLYANAYTAVTEMESCRDYQGMFGVLERLRKYPLSKAEIENFDVLFARSCLRLGNYKLADSAFSHHTLQRWEREKNSGCIRGYLDYSEFESCPYWNGNPKKDEKMQKALTDLKSACQFADLNGAMGVPDAREAALRLIRLARQMQQDVVARHFGDVLLRLEPAPKPPS